MVTHVMEPLNMRAKVKSSGSLFRRVVPEESFKITIIKNVILYSDIDDGKYSMVLSTVSYNWVLQTDYLGRWVPS